MKQFLKRAFRNQAFKTRRLVGLEKSLVLSGEIRAAQIANDGPLQCLADAEFSVFSQWGEDGILTWLVDRLKPANRTFVEFGVEDYRESNTRFLLISKNWSGLVIDGSDGNIASIRADEVAYKYNLQTVCAFITRDNIQSLIQASSLGPRLGILSVDIDGNDYWVLERAGVDADIVVVEYNHLFGGRAVSIPYRDDFSRHDAHPSGLYWGASLDAFRHLLEGKGYVFAGTNKVGTNAFFVHGDHKSLVGRDLIAAVSYSCHMREARTMDGQLAFKTYPEVRDLVDDLPLVDVTTNATFKVRDLFQK